MFKFTDLKESYSNLLIGHSIEWVRFNYFVFIFLRRVDSYSNYFRPKKKKKKHAKTNYFLNMRIGHL